MTPATPTNSADAFQSAIETHDFQHAAELLQEYVADVHTQDQILQAQHLIRWAIGRTKMQKARLSEELMLASRLIEAYGARPPRHTWEVDA